MSESILYMKDITKVYPNGFVANNHVTLDCKKGEIHALLGENGAGKTTLMKVLFGFEIPDEGEIFLKGESIRITNPLDALKHGIGMVHQHFMLVNELSVAENIVLGEEPETRKMLDLKKANQLTKEFAQRYSFDIDPTKKVGECSIAVKQKIEILKALYRGAEILILDEPTAVLTPQETTELFVQLKQLRENGHTIIFISHKLDEVKELCDSFTVLRKGKVVGTGNVGDYTKQEISNQMVGREVMLNVRKLPLVPDGKVVAQVQNLSFTNAFGKKLLDDVSFSLREGHILGVAGVEGNGQNELCEILTGMKPFKRGQIRINGKDIQGMSVRDIRNAGVSSIAEDRMIFGCAGNQSIMMNLIADRYYKEGFSKGWLLNKKAIEKEAKRYIEEYGIACPSPKAAAMSLSGGNLQKVIVAREFTSGANIIVANQPTRGIDVGSTEFIRNKLVELSREENVAVLLVSADLNEVLDVSDSIVVMCGGCITAYFPDASKVNDREIGEYMLGVKKMQPSEMEGLYHES